MREKQKNMKTQKTQVLVTGATGYIGGRLATRLLAENYSVRVMTRGGRERLDGRPWAEQVTVASADALKPETLDEALAGIDVAYYLVHSMKAGEKFHQRDLVAAHNFGQAAARAGVSRIIYLSGLGNPDDDQLSEHLLSRQETGEVLRQAGVPVTEFRAAIVVGSGSISFEMIRYLTERLPVMICPRWVFTRVQPIAIDDVLSYLAAALDAPESSGRIIEIGGKDVLTYGQMMQRYGRVRDLRRLLLPVPVLTPRLSSYWVHLVTPIPASIAQPLIQGLHNEVVVRSTLAQELFPEIEPVDYETAVYSALDRIREGHIETLWSDALSTFSDDLPPVFLTEEQGMIIERRKRSVAASPAQVYRAFTAVGGRAGWFRYNWVWRLRGGLDRWFGGVGMRGEEPYLDELLVGKALDFWRVEALKPDQMLRLRAEMKLPGYAWLQFEASPLEEGRTELVQTAFYAPRGLLGLFYWYVLLPFHGLIFGNMIEEIGHRAEQLATGKALEAIIAAERSALKRDLIGLLGALLLPLLVGAGGAVATASSLSSWYRRLKKPAWNPPDRIFGPVWTALYGLMGLASWLVWRQRRKDEKPTGLALGLYTLQLGLNFLWSFIFFGWRRPGLALVEIISLWVTLLATTITFKRVRRLAAWLMLPYLVWVTFAAALNAAIWWLNRRS